MEREAILQQAALLVCTLLHLIIHKRLYKLYVSRCLVWKDHGFLVHLIKETLLTMLPMAQNVLFPIAVCTVSTPELTTLEKAVLKKGNTEI